MGPKNDLVHDFGGFATKAGIECTDGRTIQPNAFLAQHATTVPLVWAHNHKDPMNILGHAILEDRDGDVYAYGFFNDTTSGQTARKILEHGDVESLSIWANQLKETVTGRDKKSVVHGHIREVSIVLAGANPGARIDYVAFKHSDGEIMESDEEAIIHTGLKIELGEDVDVVEHADDEGDGETIQDVIDSMNEKQKNVMAWAVGAALEEAGAEHSDADDGTTQTETTDEGTLAHQEGTIAMNVFDKDGKTISHGSAPEPHLSHDQLMSIVSTAKKTGSFKDAILAHASEYGITNIEVLFPDAVNVNGVPQWITRQMEWVAPVLNGARKIPTARWKSRYADLTHEDARAKGYIKGNLKKEQYFAIAGRENGPTTIYKKQKLDRDDIIDITDFDVVAWIWGEMRVMLNEEIARAILIGDGRDASDEDKINESKIRPIAFDDDFYAHRVSIPNNATWPDMVDAVVRSRQFYKGVGNPTFYTTESTLAELLLVRDEASSNRRLFPTMSDLQTALRVRDVVPVEVMEGVYTDQGPLIGIFVNMSDYTIGTDRGGQITTFDDFDIDYNQYKYLIEGRMSGALEKHKTAIVLTRTPLGLVTSVNAPTFVSGTGVVTIVATTNVVYKNRDTGATLATGAQAPLAAGDTLKVRAEPAPGYALEHVDETEYEFTRPSA